MRTLLPVYLVLSALAACAGDPRPNVLAEHGIKIELPESWDARIVKPGPGYAPYLLAATFQLPPNDNARGHKAKRQMEPGDILINVVDYETSDQQHQLPHPALRPSDVHSPFEGQASETQAQATRAVGRIQVWVTFASDPNSATLARVNSILATLRVG